jgi:2-iminobutanoate/2-iminopropanoate deaminase
MTKRSVTSDKAPAAIGPYSQAIVAEPFIFAAGQTPLDPASGMLVAGGIEEQTARVLENLKAVLEAAGSSLDKAVKTTVFLTDMADFAAMNGVYARYFKGDFPARSTVAVAGLPKGARVEIELVAIR